MPEELCELCRELSCCGSPWSTPDVNPPSALYLSTLRLLTALLWGPALLWDWILPFAERRTQWVFNTCPRTEVFLPHFQMVADRIDGIKAAPSSHVDVRMGGEQDQD